MLTPLLLIALAQESATVGRYEMGERLKLLDVAWTQTPDRIKRTAAVQAVSSAVTNFFLGKYGPVCASLDKARAALEGRVPAIGDAVQLRFASATVEPQSTATLIVDWAYVPEDARAVKVAKGATTIEVQPGERKTLSVRTASLNPEGSKTSEFGVLVPVLVEGSPRNVYLSVVRNAGERIAKLAQSSHPVAKALGQYLSRPSDFESEVSVIDYLFMGEGLQEGRIRLEDLDHVPIAKQGNTVLRAAIPKAFKGKRGDEVVAVVGLHGAGGSENLFFEGYGRGLAVREAMKRNWVFVAPRTGASAVQDSVDWIEKERGLKIRKLFVMGHSMGGGVAFSSAGKVQPKPSALALFAPASGSASKSSLALPLFLAVGDKEMGMLKATAQSLAREFSERDNFEFFEASPSDHLMIVADALPKAFAFLDRHAR